jgi:hypothetical protein
VRREQTRAHQNSFSREGKISSLGIISSNTNERVGKTRDGKSFSSPLPRVRQSRLEKQKKTKKRKHYNTYTYKMRVVSQQMMRASTSFAEGAFLFLQETLSRECKTNCASSAAQSEFCSFFGCSLAFFIPLLKF